MFEEACNELGLSKNSFKRLQATRWSCRHQSLSMVIKTYPALIKALEKIQTIDRRREVLAEASGLCNAMTTFEFILNLLLWQQILQELNVLSKYLQSSDMDIHSASELVNATVKNLTKLRQDDHFKNKIEAARKMAEDANADTEFAVRRKRTKKRMPGEEASDEAISDAESRFRVDVYYKCLDTLIMQLQVRFEKFHSLLGKFSCLHPSRYKTDGSHDMFKSLTEAYKDDCVAEDALHEYKLLTEMYATWESEKDVATPKTISNMLKFLLQKNLLHVFPNIATLMKIYLTIPASSASAERSFSRMKLIQTYLRSSMTTERMSGLALISIERKNAQELINYDKIIETFAKMKKRRVLLD